MLSIKPVPSVREGPHGISLTETGSGIPVFLLHGIGSSGDVFLPQLEKLGTEFHVVAWDAPGYGRSKDTLLRLSMDDFADMAADCIRDVFGSGAHVVGMSWGGVIATRLALRHPELVRSLVLGSSTVGSAATEQQSEAMLSRVPELEILGVDDFSKKRAPRLIAEDTPDEVKAEAVNLMTNAIRLPGYEDAANSMAATDHTAQLPEIAQPTLVIWGQRDQITGHQAAIPLIAGINGAVGVEVKDVGHLTNWEAPENFSNWIASFALISERMGASAFFTNSQPLDIQSVTF